MLRSLSRCGDRPADHEQPQIEVEHGYRPKGDSKSGE